MGRTDFTSAPRPRHCQPLVSVHYNGVLLRVTGFGREVALSVVLDIGRQQAEERLRQSELSYRSLFDSLAEAVFVQDSGGKFLAVNEGAARMYGRPREWFVGKTPMDTAALERNDPAVLAPALAKALSGEPQVFEFWGVRSDGTEFPKEVHLTGGNWYGQKAVFAVALDISERRAAEEKLRQSELSYRSLFDSLAEAVFVQDSDGKFLAVNEGAARMYGRPREWFVGKTPMDTAALERNDPTVLGPAFAKALSGEPQVFEFWGVHSDGTEFPKEVHLTGGNWFGQKAVFAVALDITERIRHQQQLEHIAHYDTLTGLPNRLMLADRLSQAMARAGRRSTLLAIVYLDLDGFKAVNDRYGHDMGDKLLAAIAQRMQHVLREGDTLARLGGDEFVAVLLDLDTRETSVAILDRLLAAASLPISVEDHELKVSASLGVTFFPQAGDVDADQLIRQADHAMYQAKEAGKNRYHLFDAALA